MEKVMDYLARALLILSSVTLLFITSLGLFNNYRIDQQGQQSTTTTEKRRSPTEGMAKATPDPMSEFSAQQIKRDGVKTKITTSTITTPTITAKPASITPSGTPLFTNQSIPQQPKSKSNHSPSQQDYAIYKKMKKTCDFWSSQYRQNGKELSRLNMNISCRDASKFSRDTLGKPVAANYADYKTQTRTNRNSAAVAYNGAGGGNHPSCENWRNAIDKINQQLKAGYRENTGNRLRERRRQLSDLIYKQC